MKRIIFMVVFIFAMKASYGQCSFVSVAVASSDTSYVQLYHPGFFILPSGFDNICEWEIATFSNELIYQATTSGSANDQGLILFDHSVPITDSMKINLVITNNTEGIICTIQDTLYWKETEVIPGSFIGNWDVLSRNGGVEDQIASSSEYEFDTEEIKIFPSIVTDYFQIGGKKDYYDLSILNLNGQILKNYHKIQWDQKVDISNFPSGIYFVQFYSKEYGNIEIKKIIKR